LDAAARRPDRGALPRRDRGRRSARGAAPHLTDLPDPLRAPGPGRRHSGQRPGARGRGRGDRFVMNTLLLIPDGIGVRNFVLGSFLTELRHHSRATILHDLPAGLAEREEVRGAAPADVEWRALPSYKEDLVAFELRQALAYSHLYWGNTFGMRCMLVANRPTGSLKNRAA